MGSERTRVVTLISLFRQTAKLMVDELLERLNDAGYEDQTAAHHPVFENIDPGGTRLTVLAARAGMAHQSMSELVQALERGGYVERSVDPVDSRARLVQLTRRGRRSVRKAIEEIEDIETVWLERFRRAGLHEDLREVLASSLREWDEDHSAVESCQRSLGNPGWRP